MTANEYQISDEHLRTIAMGSSSGTVSSDDAVKAICNNVVALPEDGAPGNLLHLPVTWLGAASTELELDDDSISRARAQRLGWRKGPRVLFVLPNPASDDVESGTALAPNTFGGTFLRNTLEKHNIPFLDVLVTHAYRFALPSVLKTYSSKHAKSNFVYVTEDIENCRPNIIVTFGAAALKSVLGNKTKLDSVRGSLQTYTFRDGTTCDVVPTCSHMSFYGSHADIDQFSNEMEVLAGLLRGVRPTIFKGKDYRVIDTADGVEALCKELEALKPKRIAFDTEFGNDVAREEFRYTCSVQLAWNRGCAAFVQFRKAVPQDDVTEEVIVKDKDGNPKVNKDGSIRKRSRKYNPGPLSVRTMSDEDERRAWAALQKLFLNPEIQIAGQHLRVDVEQFYRAGYPIDLRIADGFDTMLVHYVLRGDDSHGLDSLVRTYAPEYGAYWADLDAWLDSHHKNAQLQFGFRNIPPDIIIPYGLADADATWVVAGALERELERYPRLKNLYWNYTAWTSLHLLDVERHGLLVDDERRMEMREAYAPVYADLLQRLRDLLKWPEFSPSSKVHVAYLLFNKHVYKDRDKGAAAAPADANLLSLAPLYNTDKYPKAWEEIIASGEAAYSTPSTETDALDILLSSNKDLEALVLLKHLSVLGKFLSSYLTPVELNAYGVPVDGDGFHNNIRADGRVTTHLSQLTSTGRNSSKKANLQTSPKKQEAALKAALVYHKFGISLKEYEKRTFDGDQAKGKPAYTGADRIEKADRIVFHKFKSCIVAPEGYSLIEVDFKTAEIFVWAYASGDPALVELVKSGRDVHSEVAVMSYNLPMKAALPGAIAAFKSGDRSAYDTIVSTVKSKYEALRTSAKACLAEGTPVLTERRGWVAIQDIKLDDRIWDGSSWVEHEGVICKGEKPVIDIAGVYMTPDHKIVTNVGWLAAAHVDTNTHLSRLGMYSETGQLFLSPTVELALRRGKPYSGVSAVLNGCSRETPTATSPSESPRAPSPVNSVTECQLQTSSRSRTGATVRVYDIVNAGPNHRFQAGSLLVSNCIFGIMYGRSAGALSRALTSAGTPTSVEDCQSMINEIAASYPLAWKWLKDNAEFAVENGYIENAFGARRYFPGVHAMTEAQKSAVRREAMNGPIQGAVAYLLAQAGILFYKLKYMTDVGKDIDFRILLPIHDAFLIEVRDDHVDKVKSAIKLCMSTLNKLPGTDYYLDVDVGISKRWGEEAH